MDDIVEQGCRDRRGSPPWLRGSALALAAGLGVVVIQPQLLSADPPAPHRPPAAHLAKRQPLEPAQNTSQGVSIVVRHGDHLERYEAGSGRRHLATLPPGLPHPASFVHSPRRNGAGPLLGVDRDVLFRTSPVRARRVTPIAPATRVLGVSPRPGRLFVLQPGAAHHGQRLVELDALTGLVTDRRPFPGYQGAGPWRPTDVVSMRESSALLLTRAAGGGHLDLALAWDSFRVRSAGAARFTRIGSTSRLLGVSGTHILSVDDRPDTCIDRGCPVTVASVTGAGLLTRAIDPPPGWIYRAPVVGSERGDPLIVVARVGDPGRFALARLFGGGRLGLLVAGTDGLAGSVTPAHGPDGTVVFAVPRPEGLRLSVLLPGAESAALLLDLPALEAGAELVCACR